MFCCSCNLPATACHNRPSFTTVLCPLLPHITGSLVLHQEITMQMQFDLTIYLSCVCQIKFASLSQRCAKVCPEFTYTWKQCQTKRQVLSRQYKLAQAKVARQRQAVTVSLSLSFRTHSVQQFLKICNIVLGLNTSLTGVLLHCPDPDWGSC